MSNSPMGPPQGAGPTPSSLTSQAASEKKQRNVLAIVALVVAIVGFIFACIPGALLVGWILLPIAFILALVSLFMKGKKGLGLTALVVSVVGTVVGVFVFFSVMTSAVDDAFSSEDISATPPDAASDQAAAAAGPGNSGEASEAQNNEGTRANPYPIGTAITQGDWTVTVNSTTLDATQTVMNAKSYNEAPADGSQYLLANITATYNGDNSQGENPLVVLEYVTAEGTTVGTYDSVAVPPNDFDQTNTLYTGASTTGNIALEVPTATAGEGVLAVTPDTFGDKAFVAVQ